MENGKYTGKLCSETWQNSSTRHSGLRAHILRWRRIFVKRGSLNLIPPNTVNSLIELEAAPGLEQTD